MNTLVKMIINDDRDDVENINWHLSVFKASGNMLFCTGEFYGFGEGFAECETKYVKRGGITCDECLSFIREIKSVKL